MTVKELKEALSEYREDAEIVVDVNDNICKHTYTKCCYDFGVCGDNDTDDKYFGRERNAVSDIVIITLYR